MTIDGLQTMRDTLKAARYNGASTVRAGEAAPARPCAPYGAKYFPRSFRMEAKPGTFSRIIGRSGYCSV